VPSFLPEERMGTPTQSGQCRRHHRFFFEGVVWYATTQCARKRWDFWRVERLLTIFVFVDLPVSGIRFFYIFSLLSFGLDVLFAPAVVATLYQLVAIY
jgi:hypothetical protein